MATMKIDDLRALPTNSLDDLITDLTSYLPTKENA